eukprot:872624-Prorocentrum_minimum.AAC.7
MGGGAGAAPQLVTRRAGVPKESYGMARAARFRREQYAPTEGTRRTSKNTRVLIQCSRLL